MIDWTFEDTRAVATVLPAETLTRQRALSWRPPHRPTAAGRA
jgi:hypothetical protein